MHETIALLLTHARMVWRFRWLALVLAAIICMVGWSAVVLMPSVYQVQAKVFLDTRSMLRPLLRGIATNLDQAQSSVRLMQRTLLVRPNLEQIARQTDLDLEAKTPEQFDALIARLKRHIRLSGAGRDNIFNLGFTDKDPQVAARVVEAILNLFVERSLGESRKDVGSTKQFLDKQIAEYEARLTAAENRLKEFKRRNVGQMPGSQGSYYSRLQKINEQLAGARLQVDEATKRRDEFRRQIEEQKNGKAANAGPALPHPLDGRIASLEQQLDQLLLKYTERHPDVVSSRGILAELNAERDSTPVAGDPNSPFANQIELAMRQMDAEVAALSARVEEYERRSEELRKLVDTVPRIEAEMKRLDRDYSLNKSNYNSLLKRRESLALGERANQAGDSMQFRIIEPPRVPLKPTGPDRPLLSATVLGAALGAGIGFAWLVAMLRPALYSRDELEQLFSLHVIGTVTRTWTRSEVLRRRMEVVTFFFGCMVLAGSFSGLLFVETQNAELLDRLRESGVLQTVVRKVESLV